MWQDPVSKLSDCHSLYNNRKDYDKVSSSYNQLFLCASFYR